MMTPEASVTPPRVNGPPLTVLLLGMALLPMVFVGWIAWAEYRQVEGIDDLAEETRVTAVEIATLDDLRLTLVEEQAWFTALVAARELSVPLDLVEALVGVHIEEEYLTVAERVDDLLLSDAAAGYRTDVDDIRSTEFTDAAVANAEYRTLITRLSELTADLRQTLEDRAGDVTNGADIVQASRIVGAANAARFAQVRHVWAYFEAEFGSLLDAAPSYVALVEYRNALGEALDLIDRKVDPDSPVAPAMAALRENDDVRVFAEAVDAAIVVLFDPAVPAREGLDAIARITELADVFAAGVSAIEPYDALTEAAAVQMEAATDDVVSAARREFLTTMVLMVVIASLSFAGAVALARYIARPMVRLADATERLGTGVQLELQRHGPAEVRKVGAALSAASKNLVRMERLEHEATHDELTGIPSRRLVRSHLEQALARSRRSSSSCAVMFVDVDRFKQINDAYGHAAGDEVLRVVAGRIRRSLRETDVVGRYGGDEFIVVAESLAAEEDARHVVDRLIDDVASPIDLSGVSVRGDDSEIRVSVSVGVSLLHPDDASIEDVLGRADSATYRAKAAGRNRAVIADGPAPIADRPLPVWAAPKPVDRHESALTSAPS